MRIDSLELHNHLSHELTRVDFNGTRLATFTGPNGAGKSSLLESIKYVLYDDGRGRSDSMVRLGATDMSASITFAFNGAEYRATRGRTTKAGGKSYLELAVQAADGSWTPLTGDDIRSTQERIRELLGMDADAFGTSVFLAQGQANRFADLTPGDRKRVLGQVLGLEIYARAETRGRELARDLEARTAAERSNLERLDTTLLNRVEFENDHGAALEVRAEAENEGAQATAEREAATARIAELDVALGAIAGLIDQVAALEAERASRGEAWRRATGRISDATLAIVAAERTLADSATVQDAVDSLPAMQHQVDQIVAAESADRMLGIEIRQKQMALEASGREYDAAIAGHRARYEAARRRVDELAIAATALEPVVCEKCGHANIVDQAGIRPALDAARAEFRGLEGAEPKAPTGLLREQAALSRLEAKRRELAFDAERFVKLQADVTRVAALAARAESMAIARGTIERARAAVAEAEVEKAQVAERGQVIASRIAELGDKVAEADPLREERATRDRAALEAKSRQETCESRLRVAGRVLAGLEAQLEQLDRLQVERDELASSLEAASVDLARLRRLVTAFGVTGIPARIIEGVLPELARYANELLAELRPGMTLELRAQRAKKDGSGVVEALDLVVRDDVGERSLAMFSGGERMSVSLALAVALSRLVARRAGTAIRTFVIDEPDGLDAEARRAFGQALRVLAHHGELERVVVVSHHEDLAEIGDAIYRVTKNGRGSVVTQVA